MMFVSFNHVSYNEFALDNEISLQLQWCRNLAKAFIVIANSHLFN